MDTNSYSVLSEKTNNIQYNKVKYLIWYIIKIGEEETKTRGGWSGAG
jgi:hypothetical protein